MINTIKFATRLRTSIKFHSEPVYDEKLIKAKVREFDGVIKTNLNTEYRMKKTKTTKFINTEVESESESDTELELNSETEPDTE